MTIKIKKYRNLLLALLVCIGACSPENAGIVGYSYHNVTAKFNAYFIANEKLLEVLSEIEDAHENNFNKVLKIKAPIDSNVVNANKEKIEDVIKKASIAIQRHETSKWVDDSYILIGICRMLNREYPESIETLKYVNVDSENEQTKHLALTYLIRTFTEYGELENALAVIDYLNRQSLSKQNKRLLYLNAAHFYQVSENPNNVIKYLSAAVKLMSRGPEKAKIHFILGQLYQKSKLDAIAYDNYNQVLKNRPPYELSFYARLNMAQVTELSKGDDVKKIRKYFEQLLKDGKNLEFRDKIYYEMAEFEMKQNNVSQAIAYYESSIKESLDNPRQKSFSYHKLGLLYFENLKKYSLAQAYYDSAFNIMPEDESIYPQVATRQAVLSDFVKQINTIQENDSLIKLAKMDSIALNQLFLTERKSRIEKEKEKNQKARRAERNQAANNNIASFSTTPNLQTTTAPGGGFYFYDPSTVAQGRNSFRRTWGDRSLQDNWRTKETKVLNTGETASAAKELGNSKQNISDQFSEEFLLNREREAFFSSIPFAEERQQELKSQMEEAYYKLGNIYNFDLQEKKEAIETYETLLTRFPKTEYRPELLYLLYIYYAEQNEEIAHQYSNELLTKFAETIFAKLIENPNYREESNLASVKVKSIYERAYRHYQKGNYEASIKEINEGLDNYPDNDFQDNLKLLEALIIAITDGKNSYKFKLQTFLSDYPESELQEFAKSLLTAIDNVEKKQLERNEIRYIPYFQQSHYFVVLYEKNKEVASALPNEIQSFANNTFPEQNLNAGNLIFNDQYSMILLSEFEGKSVAEAFYIQFNGDLSPLRKFDNLNFSNFIISKDNFQIFYQAKVADSYKEFFNTHYKTTQ